MLRLRGRRRRSRTTNNIPLVIDNTLASPYLVPAARARAPTSSCTRPPSSSAVTARRSAGSSSTAGSSTTRAAGASPNFTEPDPSYHGLVFSQLPEPLRPAQYILKARLQYQRDIGPAIVAVQLVPVPPGPRDAVAAHGAALARTRSAVAQWLEARDEVEWVIYPGPGVEPVERAGEEVPAQRARARSSSFGIKGGLEAGQKFVDSLELHSHLANVGDVRSLAIHPATTTHQQLDADEQATTGVTARPRAPVGRHRVDRRHPRRPRRRVPRREVAEPTSVTRRRPRSPARGGRATIPGAGSSPRFADGLKLEAGGALGDGDGRLRDVGHARARRVERGPRAARAHRRQPRRRARGSRATATSAGGTASSGPACPIDTDRFFVVCPNVLGGCQGTTGPSSDAPDGRPYGSRFPVTTIRDQVALEVALADELGIDRWYAVDRRLDGRHARARVGRRSPRARRRAPWSSRSARRPPRRRSRCATCRSARSGPTRSGAAATTTTPSPATARTRGSSIARGIGHISYRTELELAARFGRDHQPGEEPFVGGRYAVESYLDYHGDKLVRRFDANTYLVLSRGDEPPRRRPRPRRHRRRARRPSPPTSPSPACRRTGSTRCACSRSSGELIPTSSTRRDRADHLRPRRLPRRVRAARPHHPPRSTDRCSRTTGSSPSPRGCTDGCSPVEGASPLETASRAWWRSATRSSVVSMPTDRRMSAGVDRRAASRPRTRGSSAPGAR